VVGIDDIPLASLLYPSLTTVHQPIEKISEAAVDLLVKRLGGPGGEPARHLVFEPHLVVRSSTGGLDGGPARQPRRTIVRRREKKGGNSTRGRK
jgi:hypothetical protein